MSIVQDWLTQAYTTIPKPAEKHWLTHLREEAAKLECAFEGEMTLALDALRLELTPPAQAELELAPATVVSTDTSPSVVADPVVEAPPVVEVVEAPVETPPAPAEVAEQVLAVTTTSILNPVPTPEVVA